MFALGLVPVVATLLNYENVLKVLSSDEFHGGVPFRFPAPIIDAWSLTNAQVGGVNVDLSLSALLLVALVALEGVLAAGYLGVSTRHSTGTRSISPRTSPASGPQSWCTTLCGTA